MFTQIGLGRPNPKKKGIHVQTFLNEHIDPMEGICRIRSNFHPWVCPWNVTGLQIDNFLN